MGTEDNPAFNSIDAPLWFFWAVQNYLANGGTDAWERYGESMKAVLDAYRKGTSFNIGMRENGLIYAAAPKIPYLDGRSCQRNPRLPSKRLCRRDKCPLVQRVCFALDMAAQVKDRKFIKEYEGLPGLINSSFHELFCDHQKGYLADYVNDEEGKN